VHRLIPLGVLGERFLTLSTESTSGVSCCITPSSKLIAIGPQARAVETGNRLDEFESIVEIASHPENENVVELLVMKPGSTQDEWVYDSVLQVRCEPR